MAKKTQAEIEELFNPYLRDGEEFRWVGEPKNNFWKPNLTGILEASSDTLESTLYVALIGLARILIQIIPTILVFGVLLTLLGLLLTIILVQVVNILFFIRVKNHYLW
jgi:hypothetical protein